MAEEVDTVDLTANAGETAAAACAATVVTVLVHIALNIGIVPSLLFGFLVTLFYPQLSEVTLRMMPGEGGWRC